MKKYYYGAAAGALLGFFTIAFYEQNLIPAEWDKEVRLGAIFIMLIGAFFACLAVGGASQK